jgi:hypothetical protein
MSEQGEDREQAVRDEIAALEAFEAQFKPDDFVGVARPLTYPGTRNPGMAPGPLLPEFRFFVESCLAEKLSPKERIDRAEKLRDAAAALDALLGPGGARSGLSRRFWGSNLITDQFTDTLRILAHEVDSQIQRLRSSSRGRAGRPSPVAYNARLAPLDRFASTMDGASGLQITGGIGACDDRRVGPLHTLRRGAQECSCRAGSGRRGRGATERAGGQH